MAATGDRARRHAIRCTVGGSLVGAPPTASLLRHGYAAVVADLCALTGVDANAAFLDAAAQELANVCRGGRRLDQVCAGAFPSIDALLGTEATFEHRHLVVTAARERAAVELPDGSDRAVADADIGHFLAALRDGELRSARDVIELGAQLRRELTVESLCRRAARAATYWPTLGSAVPDAELVSAPVWNRWR